LFCYKMAIKPAGLRTAQVFGPFRAGDLLKDRIVFSSIWGRPSPLAAWVMLSL
jgi:hypothetical protein